MTYSPMTGLVYIPVLDLEFKYGQNNAFKYQPGSVEPRASIPT